MTDLVAEARALLDAADMETAATGKSPDFAPHQRWWRANGRALLDRCEALQRERDEAIGQRNRALNALKLDTDERDAALDERDALQRKLDNLNTVPHPSPQGTP